MLPTESKPPAVALGVTGSIAAYKACDLASRLRKLGLDVHVLMTESATRLVQPRTFLTVSGNRVVTSLWDIPDWQPEHIALADRAQLLVVAPATANFLGKLAHGIADDALSTVALSHEGPVLVAPAMNPRMWAHPSVQANCALLAERGVRFVGPESGLVACGDEGVGRMAEPEILETAIRALLAVNRDGICGLRKRVLVTAGPTCEDIDPVRFLTNRSSGRMGYALAAAAWAGGCEVTLVSGPTGLRPPWGCRCVPVRSAAEMADAVLTEFPTHDILFMAAAVADYSPAQVFDQKLHKTGDGLALQLTRTRDILSDICGVRKPGQVVVGFAAETEQVRESARGKLTAKGLDWIAANDVSQKDAGFASKTNEILLLGAHGSEERLPMAPKIDIAAAILARVVGAVT